MPTLKTENIPYLGIVQRDVMLNLVIGDLGLYLRGRSADGLVARVVLLRQVHPHFLRVL